MQDNSNKKSYRKWCEICVLLLLLTGCSGRPQIHLEGFQTELEAVSLGEQSGLMEAELLETESSESETDIQEQTEETEKEIQVFVCGAVDEPGVYRLKETSRLYEAVEAAGGFRQDADQEWLNQAEVLQDGSKIRIYTLEETRLLKESGFQEQSGIQESQAEAEVSGKINLNTATKDQLMTLPGIGEAKADAVIAYREEHGSFRTIEDIMNISGIKEAVFLKIKDKIVV